MSLYLKYRPQQFADLVGQKHISDILLAQAQADTFSHNYLLYGPRGTGKTTTARLLAKMVNAASDDLLNDPIVQLIDAGQTLDYVEIDAASHTGVDNIREEIIDKALYQPTHLKKKVYVIDEVHMLSKGAFNALLKIMEEPPAYLMFVLATTEINKVPDTIISRCQVFNFKRIGIDPMVERLKRIAGEEGFEFDEAGLRLIAKLSSGALRDAIKYMEQVSMLGAITADQVTKFLGVTTESVLQDTMECLQTGDFRHMSELLDTLYTGGTDMIVFAKDLLLWLDEHFMENPESYSTLAGVMREIYRDIKTYPYPVLVFKSKLRHRFAERDGISPVVIPSSAKKGKKLSMPEYSPEKKSAAPTTPSVQEEKIMEKSAVVGSLDADTIVKTLAERTHKKMLQSILKQSTIVQSYTPELLHLIITNKQYHMMLEKAESMTYLTELLQSITGKNTQLKAEYMSKEDYLAQAMG